VEYTHTTKLYNKVHD